MFKKLENLFCKKQRIELSDAELILISNLVTDYYKKIRHSEQYHLLCKYEEYDTIKNLFNKLKKIMQEKKIGITGMQEKYEKIYKTRNAAILTDIINQSNISGNTESNNSDKNKN